MHRTVAHLSIVVWLLAPNLASAVTIDTVPVGNAGNDGEVQLSGTFGGVAYNYRIATTEVTNAQYADFLNAVAATDTYALYNSIMGSATWAGITRSGSPRSYTYSVKNDAVGQGPNGSDYEYGNTPVNLVTWGDAARFANWLHNGQPTGLQDSNTTEDGAYTLNGATSDSALLAVARNPTAQWFIPSENEWYKAAYYDGDSATYNIYPTGTDATPDNNLPSLDTGNSANFQVDDFTTGDSNYPFTDVGAYTLSSSQYGTFDQGGNMQEWTEGLAVGGRVVRGGDALFFSNGLLASNPVTHSPALFFSSTGFRVATIPEPSTVILAAMGLVGLLAFGWRRRKKPNG